MCGFCKKKSPNDSVEMLRTYCRAILLALHLPYTREESEAIGWNDNYSIACTKPS